MQAVSFSRVMRLSLLESAGDMSVIVLAAHSSFSSVPLLFASNRSNMTPTNRLAPESPLPDGPPDPDDPPRIEAIAF
jgi:hypothetical protein